MYTPTEIKERLYPVFSNSLVEQAILFGSYAKNEQLNSSDVDIVIDSKGKIRGIDFFGVLEDVTNALKLPVDLIEASQIISGSKVQYEIEKTGVVIYEKS
jgi:hypothetical protein